MECPKCKQTLPANRSTCLYCGASLDGTLSNQTSRIDIADNIAVIVDEKRTNVDITDLKESDLQKIEDAIRAGKNEVVEESQTQIQEISCDGKDSPPIDLTFEKILTVLDKLKASYSDGHIDYGNYKKMVVELVKDTLSTLDNTVKVNFVVNEISASELSEYLDDAMLKDLRAIVLSSVSSK